MDVRHNITEIFVHSHFFLRKIHYWQGRVLADGVTFRHGEPNGGGWFWWWNWRAFACMLLALVLVGVGTLGTMKNQQYVSKESLWIPGNAPILADMHKYERLFGSMDAARIMLTANPGYDPNLMEHGMLTSLWRLHTYITTELTVTVQGKNYGFTDLCVNVTLLGVTGCYQLNPLAFWPAGLGPGVFQRPSYNVGAAINDPASLFLNPWTRIEDIFGGITRVNGKIVAVAALQVHYFFDSSPQRHATNPDWVEVLQSFEDALLDALKRYTFAEIAPNINLSYNKEVYSSMIADWPYLGASVCIMLVILGLAFLSMEFVHHSRVYLGIIAALTVAFVITSTQGAASVLFLSETVFDTYAIFLVAIIGLNHLFIIIHTYDRVIDKELLKPEPQLQKGHVNQGSVQAIDNQATFRLLVTETLAEAMPSITAVYLIGIPIFGIGILSEYCFEYEPIAGLISMSATCGFGLLVLYITINLLFLPALVLDALRVVENRTDVLFLKRQREHFTRSAPVIGDVIEVASDLALPPPPPYERLCHVLFRKAISPVMTKLPVKIAIISLIVLTVGLSIFVIGSTQFALSPHPRQDNLPSENYLAAYYSVQDEFFSKAGTPVSLVITHADYTNEKTLATINSFLHKVEDSGCARPGSIANWYSNYIMYLVSKGQNITDFYQPQDGTNTTNIALWLDSPSGGQYAKALIFHNNGTVKAAAFTFNMAPLPASDKQHALENAHHLRDMVKSDSAIQKISEGQAIIFSDDFIYIDEPWILTKAWLAKIIVYLVLFFLLSLLFLDARSVALIVLGTACVASLIYGIIMHFLSMNISIYSISCLIMVAMVSFDFHFQIAYFWMRDKGTRTSRLMNVVTQIGTSLCCAYFAQFLGMMVLMFSLSSPINRSFAYLYVSTTSFSFVFSVIVLPIILSWVGLRRTRIVFHRKYKSVLGGMMWDQGHSEREQDGDNYWSSDDESSFYHDTDKEVYRSDNLNSGNYDNFGSQPGSYGGGGFQYREREATEEDDNQVGRRRPTTRSDGRPAAEPPSSSSMPRVASGGVEVIARSLAGGGHEVTLEQLFVMAEVAGSQRADTYQVLTSSGNVALPPAATEQRRRTADVVVTSGGGGSPSPSASFKAKLTSESAHKRTASGLRDLFFGGSTSNADSGVGGGLAPTDGLDSFPSPSPVPPGSVLRDSGRWSRESSWLSSASSRNGGGDGK